MEDYGGQDSDPTLTGTEGQQPSAFGDRTDTDVTPASNTQGVSAHEAASRSGMDTDESRYSGGGGGIQEGAGEGGQFGEFGDTGVGTDLTIEMDSADPRSGLIKGGQSGAADDAGLGQYGGKTGGVGDANRN
jgi:hypothetical protein